MKLLVFLLLLPTIVADFVTHTLHVIQDFVLEHPILSHYGRQVPIHTPKFTSIVNGMDAHTTEAPWQVLILQYNQGQWQSKGCGGTLISNRHVLTAAHCTQHLQYTDAVYINAYQPFWGNPGLPFFFTRIQAVQNHPLFLSHTNSHDVAILALANIVPDHFPPIRLARQMPVDHTILQVYGLGQASTHDKRPVNTLQVADVPIVSQYNCSQAYRRPILDDMLCAGLGQADACYGDSGGPAVFESDSGIKYQVGIVSWGNECASDEYPGVYASVPFVYSWIQSHVCDMNGVASPLCDEPVSLARLVESDRPTAEPTKTISTLEPVSTTLAPTHATHQLSQTKKSQVITTSDPTPLPSSIPSMVPTFVPSLVPSDAPVECSDCKKDKPKKKDKGRAMRLA